MLINKTTETAIQALMVLARLASEELQSPKSIAMALRASPTYMAKITGALVKAKILRSSRGIQGGVALAHRPEEIRLLDVYEACQGALLGTYCEAVPDVVASCHYHQAMVELFEVNQRIMSRWTLQNFLDKPYADKSVQSFHTCRMSVFREQDERVKA